MSALSVTLIIVGLVVVGGLLLRWRQQRSSVPVLHHCVALGEGRLLVRDASLAWRELRLDGLLSAPIDELPAGARVLAFSERALWTASPGRPLELRALPSLAPVPEVARSIANDEALSRGVEASARLADESLVIRGADGRERTISMRGDLGGPPDREGRLAIRRWDDTADGRRFSLGLGQAALDGSGASLRLSTLDLVEPRVVMDWRSGTPVTLRGPDGFLVASFDVLGPSASHSLSRVSSDGRVRWTLRAADIVGPTSLEGAVYRLLWVDLRGSEILVVAEAFRVDVRGPYQEHVSPDARSDARIVKLDPATGAVRSRVEVRR